jgi:DNA-binding CsgD family transcriptional regulator
MGDSGSPPWRRIHDYLIEVGSSRTSQELHQRAVAGIQALIRCDHVSVVCLDAKRVPECVHGTSGPQWCRDFNSYYRHRFPIPWDVVERIHVTDFRPWERSEYVSDFMRPKRLWSALWDARNPYILALYRTRPAPPFSDMEAASLKVCVAHLNNYHALLSRRPDMPRERLTATELSCDCRLLSRREAEILKLIALRMTAREMASVLFVSHRTVERHIANIYEKLSVHNRQALLRRVYEPAIDTGCPLSRAEGEAGRPSTMGRGLPSRACPSEATPENRPGPPIARGPPLRQTRRPSRSRVGRP